MGCTNHPTVVEGLVRCTRCHRQFCQDCVVVLRGFPYCGDCKGEQVRDIQSGASPGTLDLASIWLRLAARMIDGLLVGCVTVPIAIGFLFVLGAFSGSSRGNQDAAVGLFYLVFIPLATGLPLVYEALMLQSRGQTLGKMAVGVKVVTPEGGDIRPGQAWGRTAFHIAVGFCTFIGPLADTLPIFFSDERTCLHDMVAKTRVIRA